MQIHPHLAPARQDVDRPVVVAAHHHAVGSRRLRQFVHLVAQRRDVLARLAKSETETLVLGGLLSEKTLGLEQTLLELTQPSRSLLDAPPQDLQFGLEFRAGGRVRVASIRISALRIVLFRIVRAHVASRGQTTRLPDGSAGRDRLRFASMTPFTSGARRLTTQEHTPT